MSTDSEEIAEIANSYGANTPFLRPSEYATDNSTSFSVVEHCLRFYEKEMNKSFDLVALLEPTSPLKNQMI